MNKPNKLTGYIGSYTQWLKVIRGLIMRNDHSVPTPLEVIARIDQALLESGLDDKQIEREPLPLFSTLLDEWLVCQGIRIKSSGQSDWDDIAFDLLRTMSVREVKESLRMIWEETRQLCRAHGSLSVWNQRELDNRFRRMQQQIDAAASRQAKSIHP